MRGLGRIENRRLAELNVSGRVVYCVSCCCRCRGMGIKYWLGMIRGERQGGSPSGHTAGFKV